MKTTSSERRLHPLSVLFDMGSRLPRLLLPLVVLFFATGQQRGTSLVTVAVIAGLVAFVLIESVVRYLRFSYRYDATELVIRSGLFTRNDRSIPYVRIQNLDARQNPLHRLFDVAVVDVQTGGGSEPEASLRVLPAAAVDEMRARVLAAGGRTSVAPPEMDTSVEIPAAPAEGAARRTLLALGPRDLVLAGIIENRGMVLIAGALALLEQTGAITRMVERLVEAEHRPLGGLATRWLQSGDVPVVRAAIYAAAAVLLVLLFIRLLSTVWAVVRLYGFRLERVGDDLHTQYGLVTRVSATIPLRRVQTVIIREGVLHRMLGRCQVLVETAGGAAVEAGARAREPIAPILRSEQLAGVLDELHPGLEVGTIEWQPVHPRAPGRMLRSSLAWPLGLSMVALIAVQEWAIAVFVVLLAHALVHTRLRARHLAWSVTRDSVVVRDGALTRTTRIARLNRVQAVALYRNPFDLRTGMARVRADTAGAGQGLVVPYLPETTAAALQRELAARTAETAFTW